MPMPPNEASPLLAVTTQLLTVNVGVVAVNPAMTVGDGQSRNRDGIMMSDPKYASGSCLVGID
jgi:hypothetical protein